MVTQITAPDTPRHFVRQPQLERIIQKRSGTKLVLVVAPPGYGKTSFISTMANTETSRGFQCAWVSLGRQDNDERRFWEIIVAAIESCCTAFRIPEVADNFDPYDIIASIVNQTNEEESSQLFLILDNFHFITSSSVSNQISSLIENAPKNMTVIIASDCPPAFPLSALRVEESLVEICANDLRFGLGETEYYLNESLQLGLDKREVKNVHYATRGWPAGLQMARMAYIQGKRGADVISFVEYRRSGFFIDVVSSRMPEEMRMFLLKISHLPRITPLLAEYVTDMPRAGSFLIEIEHEELFAEVSHENPPQYAFSETFREALHQRALQTMPPEEIRMLHQRASEWFEQNGDPLLGVEFALKAHNPDRAGRIIAHNLPAVAAQSQGESLARILQQISLDKHLDSVAISTITAWAYCTAGKPRQALHWASLARTAARDGKPFEQRASLDVIEGRAYSLLGRFEQAIEQTEKALLNKGESGNAPLAPWTYLTARHTLGESYAHLGNFRAADEHLSYCLDMAIPSGRPVVYYLAACELAELYALLGKWDEARQLAYEALHLQQQRLVAAPWSLALVHIQLAMLALFEGAIDEAEDMAMHARKRLSAQSNSDVRLCLLLLEGQLALAQGNQAEASRAFRETLSFANAHIIPRGKTPIVCAIAIRHLLFLGCYADAYASLESLLMSFDKNDPYASTLIEITSATLSLFNGDYEQALTRADKIFSTSKATGFLVPTADALITKALAQCALKRTRSAASSLLEAAALLEPYGITYPFVSAGNRAGAPIEHVLAYCASTSLAFQREKAPEISFLRRCASLMPERILQDSAPTGNGLTPREQQVYHLLQAGLSRREISNELGIAYNTVRVHVSNIYKKTQPRHDAPKEASTYSVESLEENGTLTSPGV